MSAFDRLHHRIKEILQEQDILEPTPPQEKAIPAILAGENVLLIAPTGTGKTEAASLPIFHQILSNEEGSITAPQTQNASRDGRKERKASIEADSRIKGTKAVYITPLRALNRDMLRRFDDWGERLGISVAVRHGDTSQSDRRKQSLRPPELLITTPETLQVMLTGKRLRQNLSTVKTVVVDEVHELASSKRGSQLSVLLERLGELAGDFQRIGLSATVGSPEAVARLLVGTSRSYKIISADVERASDYQVVSPQPRGGDFSLASTLECEPRLAAQIRWIRDMVRDKKCLIFVNTRQAAEVLGSRFRQLGEPIGVHHGSLSMEARVEAEEAFKDGKLEGLICTSSMELGIDIGDVDHVIQYSSPREVSRLLQRVGRAGHKIGLVSSGSIIATCADDVAEACAIARRAAAQELEEIKIHERPADVLANQIVGLEIDSGDISQEKVHQIVARAYPFRKLRAEELEGVVSQMEEHRLVRRDGSILQRTRKAREYYFENLSMIPDEKRYNVYDIVGRRSVGTLDEAFVVGFAQPGATFVTKGEIWEITEIADEEIKVVPIQRSGEIPSWSGEEIPVPFEVACEVGRIRREISEILESGRGGADAEEGLQSCYPVDREAAGELVDLIMRQREKHHPVPDESLVVVESGGDGAVINCCFGHKTNDTLGRIITSILSARFGSSVELQIDPYRIELTVPKAMLAEEIEKLIEDLEPEYVEPILEMTLKNTTLLRWKMVHVARKFGALSRDVDYQRVSMARLLTVFEGTPMYREALREIYHDRLDIERTRMVLKRIREGTIAIATSSLSPIGTSGRGGGRDVTSPENADAAVIKLLKNRIMSDRVLLFCVNCKKWKSMRQVERVPDRPECPLCGSRMVAALKPWEEEEIKVVRKLEKKTSEEKRRTKRVFRNANLVLSYGKTAAIALASRGLGPETAARVVGKLQKDEIEFYRDILKAEKEYARTKRFWG
ncbi:MAG: DEAD/DEAH box helicase [Methanothrix sp.]|uniref:DEAD/DEAH box helicase n=1 Tax=Methanothrix sp. TaxID=90426 RepID=UPI0025EDE629|nr:DEAD/DEAH box helicase [Methanothrix sp.]MBK7385366.1 DEAD/DEAH box helicase [Methanothrix sp.]